MTTMRRPRATRRAAVAVLVVICLVPILGVMAFVLDGGLMMAQRRHSQAVADSAARAAAGFLYKNYATDGGSDPQGKARAAALAMASRNDFQNDGSKTSVIVNIPPSSGSSSFAGKAGCAEVIVTLYQPRYFSAVFAAPMGASANRLAITSRTVAQVKATPSASILLTDPKKSGALTLTGGARLTTNAGVRVNSDSVYNSSSNPSGGAVNVSNGAYFNDNGGLSVVGNVNMPSWATSSTFFSKAPVSGASAMADPFASVAAPDASTLATIDKSKIPGYGSYTLSPGVYSGGLSLNQGGMQFTMKAGVYYMKNGGFSIGNGATVTDNGAGVTIYLDASGGSLSFQGGTSVTLSAPTSGAGGGVPGIVFFQDRNNKSSLNNIANGSNVNMTGALYAPNADMTIAGGANGASYGTQFIVKSLNLSNGVNININTPASAGGSVSKPIIVE